MLQDTRTETGFAEKQVVQQSVALPAPKIAVDRTAKAAASKTNPGAVERGDVLAEKGRENKGANQYTPERVLSKVDKTHHDTRSELAKELGWSTGKVAMADRVWKEAPAEVKDGARAPGL